MARNVRFCPKSHFRVQPPGCNSPPNRWAKLGRCPRRHALESMPSRSLGDRLRDPSRPIPKTRDMLTCHRASEGRICIRQPRNHHVLHPYIHRLLKHPSPTESPLSALSCLPPSIEFQPSRPNWGLSTKCSLFTSCRGHGPPGPATKSRLSPPCYQTQTPVHPLHRVHTLPFQRGL